MKTNVETARPKTSRAESKNQARKSAASSIPETTPPASAWQPLSKAGQEALIERSNALCGQMERADDCANGLAYLLASCLETGNLAPGKGAEPGDAAMCGIWALKYLVCRESAKARQSAEELSNALRWPGWREEKLAQYDRENAARKQAEAALAKLNGGVI